MNTFTPRTSAPRARAVTTTDGRLCATWSSQSTQSARIAAGHAAPEQMRRRGPRRQQAALAARDLRLLVARQALGLRRHRRLSAAAGGGGAGCARRRRGAASGSAAAATPPHARTRSPDEQQAHACASRSHAFGSEPLDARRRRRRTDARSRARARRGRAACGAPGRGVAGGFAGAATACWPLRRRLRHAYRRGFAARGPGAGAATLSSGRADGVRRRRRQVGPRPGAAAPIGRRRRSAAGARAPPPSSRRRGRHEAASAAAADQRRARDHGRAPAAAGRPRARRRRIGAGVSPLSLATALRSESSSTRGPASSRSRAWSRRARPRTAARRWRRCRGELASMPSSDIAASSSSASCLRRRVAIVGGPRQRPPADARQRRRHVGPHRLGHRQIARAARARGSPPRTTVLPHPLADQRLPQDHAGRVDVRAPIQLVARDLLGRHVAELALDRADLGLDHRSLQLGDAEVEHLRVPLDGDEQVVRRHVAVHDTAAACRRSRSARARACSPASASISTRSCIASVKPPCLPRTITCDSGWPSRYSITSTGAPSTSMTSLVWTMFGWCRRAASRASLRNIARNSSSLARLFRSTLTHDQFVETARARPRRPGTRRLFRPDPAEARSDSSRPPRRRPIPRAIPAFRARSIVRAGAVTRLAGCAETDAGAFFDEDWRPRYGEIGPM